MDAVPGARQADGMTDPRYAIPLDELVAGVEVTREAQVELQAEPVVPPPAPGEVLPYGDGMTGDADGD